MDLGLLSSSGLYYNVIIYIKISRYCLLITSADVLTENVTSRKETVYRGSKGSFHRKQKNPRTSRKTNWLAVFIL